jgi:hypothetical protein
MFFNGLIRFISLFILLSGLNINVLANKPLQGALLPVDSSNTATHQVKIGIYPIAIYQLDMGSNTFYADLYLWLRWKGDIDPVASLEFKNMVEKWNKQYERINPNPKIMADGSKYQILKVEGRFYQPFNLTDYPLDQQKLTIQVEDALYSAEELSFVIDQENSGLGSNFVIPGWSLTGWSGQVFHHDYRTNFGEDKASSLYSTAHFNIHVERPTSYFFWRLLLPIFIVLCVALSALILSPRSIDARTGLAGGALLTAIFLQIGYSDALPELTYLVLIDKIYLLAYILIVLTLVRTILAFQKCNQATEQSMESLLQMDKRLISLQLLVFALGTAVLVWVH